mgnify:CR=1 FL=1
MPHGGINDLALIDSGDGGAVAQMAGDELQALNGLLEVLSSLVSNVLVGWCRGSRSGGRRTSHSTHRGWRTYKLRGHGGVESRVKDRNVRLVLTKDLVGGLDAQDGGGVVQGSQRAQVVDGLDDSGVMRQLSLNFSPPWTTR